MKAVLVLLALFVGAAFGTILGYTGFTATINVTNTKWNGGYYIGTAYYDWNQNAFFIKYPNTMSYTELYTYNAARGYDTTALPSQFSYQYLYKSSTICDCEISALSYSMSPLFYNSSLSSWALDASAATVTYNGASCTGYSAVSASLQYFQFYSIWLTADGTLCRFDGVGAGGSVTSYTIISEIKENPGVGNFTAPSDCKCGKPIDVVISLDRTGSISGTEWASEYQFVKDVTNAFEYGTLKTNLGIIDWNSQFWTTIDISAGTSSAAVSTAVNAMGCCSGYNANSPDTSSCCCCGTPIGGGLAIAGDMLATSLRPTATKIIILLTDGCQNHLYNATTKVVSSCSCASESACRTNTQCLNDITTNFNYVKALPGLSAVKIIAVGVGESTGTTVQICPDQLNLVTGGDTSSVFNPTDWTKLSEYVDTVGSLACSVDDTSCNDCCGLCVCGTCTAPESCAQTDVCTLNTLDDTTECCTDSSVTCENPDGDKCNTYSCTSPDGCGFTTKTCKTNTTCRGYYCDSTTGFCNSVPFECNQTIPDCYEATQAEDCDDEDVCSGDYCIDGECYHNESSIFVNCNSDKCNTRTCDATSGCIVTATVTCNDGSNCTKDTCDTATGCLYTTVPCTPSTDPCKNTTCDKILGCYNVQRNCSAELPAAGNCSLPVCQNATCQYQNVCALGPPPAGVDTFSVAIVTGIASAAVIGIVLGIVAGVAALGGGGAYAYASAAGGDAAAPVTNNPLYVGSGAGGDNPIYTPQ